LGSEGQTPGSSELREELLEDVRRFFEQHVVGARQLEPEEHHLHVAAAALMLEVSRADYDIGDSERKAVGRALEMALDVPAERTAQIVGLAEQQVLLGTRVHEFARLIDERFSKVHKRRLVELLWRVAFADAELKAQEEYLVRKIAELIHVPFDDFLEAKISARERFFERGGR